MGNTNKVENIWLFDVLFRVLLPGDENREGAYLMEQVLPPGFSPPLHIHHSEDELFYVLAGEISFRVGDEDIPIRKGDTLNAPKGIPHTFVVTGEEEARMLTITTKGDFERMARMAGRPAEFDALPPRQDAPTPDQMAAFEAACRANKIEVVGPPLAAAA